MRKIIDIGIDTETTGLVMVQKGTELPGKHDVIQVAAVVPSDINPGAANQFEAKCQPINWGDIAQQALDVHGYQIADLRTFEPSYDICVKFRAFLAGLKTGLNDKFRMVAHNMPFDYKAVRSWFLKNGFTDWDDFFLPQADCICTKKLGNRAKKEGKLPGIENMKLITAAKYIGYKFDAHDALGDTLACLKFWDYLKGLDGHVPETGGVSAAELRAEGKEPMGTDEQVETSEAPEVVGKLEL